MSAFNILSNITVSKEPDSVLASPIQKSSSQLGSPKSLFTKDKFNECLQQNKQAVSKFKSMMRPEDQDEFG